MEYMENFLISVTFSLSCKLVEFYNKHIRAFLSKSRSATSIRTGRSLQFQFSSS